MELHRATPRANPRNIYLRFGGGGPGFGECLHRTLEVHLLLLCVLNLMFSDVVGARVCVYMFSLIFRNACCVRPMQSHNRQHDIKYVMQFEFSGHTLLFTHVHRPRLGRRTGRAGRDGWMEADCSSARDRRRLVPFTTIDTLGFESDIGSRSRRPRCCVY